MTEFRKRPLLSLAVLLLALAACRAVIAHDIPNDVKVDLFFKPSGRDLTVLARVPLRAMRDVDFSRQPNGYLDLDHVDESLKQAATLWISDNLEIREGDRRLPAPAVTGTRVSLESDQSFATYEEALSNIYGPRLTNETQIYWEQGLLDVAFQYPIESDASRFSLHPQFGQLGLRVLTVIRLLTPDGSIRPFEFQGDPGQVRLDPQWHQAAFRFVVLGFRHILDGIDHLLFLFCLVIPVRRFRSLVSIVTAFTIAHSITLIASAYDLAPDALWFPPLIEALIAASIVYMALENIIGRRLEHRWMIAFGFGLVHGFGFSFALRESLQFAGSHLLTSLLSFNVGVEIGQLLVLVILVPLLALLYKYAVAERMGVIILSAIVAHTAWHWMIERATVLQEFKVPTLDLAALIQLMRWAMALMVLGALVWGLSWLQKRWEGRDANRAKEPESPAHQARRAGDITESAEPTT